MSKAEDRAMEKYPPRSILIVPARGGGYYADSHMREGFIEGYRQAEQDLRDISWIKEISSVKEMSRAEEEALKAYPTRSIAANYDTINRRDAFEYGYLKAEKDLELGWKDMSEIVKIANLLEIEWLNSTPWDGIRDCGFYQEVLKQFKDLKERKEK